MNFTVDQFIGVFHRFNEAIWPLQLVAYALGILCIVALVAKARSRQRLLPATLALFWAFMGIVFMWGFETDIMKPAYLFGALFVAEAAALVWSGVVRGRIVFEVAGGARLVAGAGMIVYALAVYPAIGALAGHAYPDAPLFGVAPCPTTIFTFGLLLMTRRFPWAVAVVPLLWSAFGSVAAFRFGIVEDLGLLASGIVTLGFVLAARRQAHTRHEAAPGMPA